MTQGQRIKELRNLHSYSQELLAEKIGVTRQAVAKWEADLTKPSTRNLIQLAELFRVSVEQLTQPDSYVCVVVDVGKEMISPKRKKKYMRWVAFALMGFVLTFAPAVYGRITGIFAEEMVFALVLVSEVFILSIFLPIFVAVLKFVYRDCKRRGIRPTFWVLISCTFLGLGYYLIRRDSITSNT